MDRQNPISNDDTQTHIRAFCGFSLNAQDQAVLDEALVPIREQLPGFRWVPTDRWHLTAQFYGKIPLDKAHTLATALAAVQLPLLEVQFRGIGTFPSNKKPGVLWVGVQGVDENLTNVATQIHDVSRSMGFPPENRPYQPHITIGRAARNTAPTWPSFEQWSDKTLGRCTLEPLTLFQSLQGSNGVRYIPIIPCDKGD